MTIGERLPRWFQPLADAVGAGAPGRVVLPEQLAGRRPPATGGRPAAVLMLFGEGPGGPDILLIERAPDLRSHAGQPAFPGGATDPGDGSPVATALREATEEVGLDPAGVRVIATLPPIYLPPSRFVVTPVLAWWRAVSPVAPVDLGETAAVARVPVAELVDPANRLLYRHPRSGTVGVAFQVRGMFVWGFTGALLDTLLRLGGWELPWRDGAAERVVEVGPPDPTGLAVGDVGNVQVDPRVPTAGERPWDVGEDIPLTPSSDAPHGRPPR
jgi:8-oxo-dGTP pyrophosphatase MutT (NUDIX family)